MSGYLEVLYLFQNFVEIHNAKSERIYVVGPNGNAFCYFALDRHTMGHRYRLKPARLGGDRPMV
jgi:hypothetical protein